MGGVPVAVVHVVGVIAVRHGNVAAVGAVLVVMTLMSSVAIRALAFVHMVAMDTVDVTVVGKICVVAVRHRDVAASLAVGMRVVGMRGVLSRTGHAAQSLPVAVRRAARGTALSFPARACRNQCVR